MITQLKSETVGDLIVVQLFRDDTKFPSVYHVLVTKDGEQLNSLQSDSETVAYGLWDGFKNYYSSNNSTKN